MDEDKKWEFDAPQHYCDLPSAITDDDSEIADQYFFAKADDTEYFEPNDDETFQELRREEEPKEQFPVIRRRSLSVGSKPLQGAAAHETTTSSSSSMFRKPVPQKTVSNKSIDNPDQHFVGGLRAYNHAKASVYEAPKVTKPVPFNLTIPKKKVVKTISENPSMAESIQKWEKKTPERFHSNRHGEPFRFAERVELRPTQPHTPQLMAVKRHRPVNALSREEQEKHVVEEMKKNQFKAHTLDEKVFKAPVLPAKKEMKMTKVEPFHLTESHKKENIPPQDPIEQEFHFHAKPAPKFETVLKERKPMPPTIPQTPKFSEAGKASLHNWRRQRSRSNGSVSTLRSGSSNGSLNSCGTERLKNTVLEPFSFEVRDKKLQEKKEEAMKRTLEEERKQREFHAKPCPNFSHPAMPERPTFSTTRLAPFQLSCDTRGQMKKEKFLQQLEELRLVERKATQFKAQPAKILNREPFKIKHDQSKNNLTHVAEFNLSTEKRAVERKTFDQFLKEREQEKEAARLQREQERVRQEEEALIREREKASFHANPIRQYRTLEIKKAELDLLTVPKTPKFMKKPC